MTNEQEVMDRLRTSLMDAMEACKELAVYSRKGQPYDTLRKNLELAEGCCRQRGAFRGDSRWLPIGRVLGEAHKRSGDWLRGWKDPITGARVMTAPGRVNKLFLMLAANLISIYEGADRLATSRTNTLGPILPDLPNETRRIGRPAFDVKPKSSLILPARLAAAK